MASGGKYNAFGVGDAVLFWGVQAPQQNSLLFMIPLH